MIKTAIIGATGYTGGELIRLLSQHPLVELALISSRQAAGKPLKEFHPACNIPEELFFVTATEEQLAECDVVFFATPPGVAMEQAPKLLERGVKVIDLSPDFRLKNAKLWQQWYTVPHTSPKLLDQAVYGLPEINRQAIEQSALVACPGCYPTAVILGFLPLLQFINAEPLQLFASASSGLSGAGRNAATHLLFTETTENMVAYAASGHRHSAEMLQILEQQGKKSIELIFTPHLVPMSRGIHATLYAANLHVKTEDLYQHYFEYYQDEPFVVLKPLGEHPATRAVRGSNYCHLAVHQGVILVTIDNLGKGAASQAVQCMNLMFSLPETCALEHNVILP